LTEEITHIENDGFLGVLHEYFLGIVCAIKEDVESYIFNIDKGWFLECESSKLNRVVVLTPRR
jgi:hypothetical protein